MPIEGIFVSGFVNLLFGKMTSFASSKLPTFEGIDTQLTNWTNMLSQIEAFLIDAEEKQLTDRAVNLWLDDLQDLAYDLDDLVDEFATEALQHKLKAKQPQASSSKVWNLIPNFKPRDVLFNFKMKSKIEEINTRLHNSFEQCSKLNLVKIVGTTPTPTTKTWQRPDSTSLFDEPHIYGREYDQRKIIELLVRGDESSHNNIGVIPIVGMGGIGKTTLAQMVYNDETVQKHFDLKAWVCVSDEFNIMRITKAILESVTSQTFSFNNLDQVQVQLKQALAGKKFLIVLDDVWNKKYSDWNVLKKPFNDGAQGSKVVVTTRDREVAGMMTTVELHEVNILSKEDCWSLFAQHAFANTCIDANPKLVSIGKEIVEKCKGLPLAARTLGGLLRSKVRDEEWINVLRSNIWDLPHTKSDILPALRLSYHDLPSHLKQCFAYCSIIPNDYEFEEEELVLLWMAEGFIQQQREKQMEDVGGEYFRELLSRSFFQPSRTGESSKFVMHDLINDLAQVVARETCFRLEDILKYPEQCKIIKKARHSSYMRKQYEGMKKFEIFNKAMHLRTFLPFNLPYGVNCHLASNVPFNLLPKLRRLRVLNMSSYDTIEVPNSVGDLKHLRYLNLSNTNIEELPESLGSLYNLQTLMLRGCRQLKKLPTDLGNLIDLRHLDTTNAHSLKEMPLGIGKLASLQTLSNFIVTKNNGHWLRELGNLIYLRGKLCLSGLQNVVVPLDAREANLNDKKGLDVLSMEWSVNSDDSRDGRVETEVLDMLQPHKNLKELHIEGYLGIGFPNWIGDPLFSNMADLSLDNCGNCVSLPPLGQIPSLKKLYIKGMSVLKHVDHEFYGQGSAKPFQLLETLSFKDMPEWEYWYTFEDDKEVEPFTHVSELSIENCPKLVGMLPSYLPCLNNLKIKKCPQLLVEVSKVVHPSLTSIAMNDVPLTSLQAVLEMRSMVDDELISANAKSKHPSSITSLSIGMIKKLELSPKWVTHGLMELEALEITSCDELKTLWKNEERVQHSLPAFRRLKIEGCPQLVSLFEEDEDEDNKGQHEQQQQQQQEGLPCIVRRLEHLTIDNCEKLEKLPRLLHNFTFLGELYVYKCPSLGSFPETGFPCTLKTLKVRGCEALQSLFGCLTQINDSNLQVLDVRDCPSLTSLISCRGGGLPPTLKKLAIWSCKKLEALLVVEEGMEITCPSLESVSIINCDRLKYLPDALPNNNNNNNNNLRNLSRLYLYGCKNLEYIPEGWFHSATNLAHLDCKWNNNFKEIDLHSLSSLTTLLIEEEEEEEEEEGVAGSSFPIDGKLLPTSLIDLQIGGFRNLEKLSSKLFQNLASLEHLDIEGCPRNMIVRYPHVHFDQFWDLGLQQPWLEGEEYLSIVDEFMEAIHTRWPKAIVQFEDFQMKWAFERLQRYQKRFCMFNNDIRGTAGVALAGLLGTVRAQDLPLTDFVDQKIVVVGAGRGLVFLTWLHKAVSRMAGAGANPLSFLLDKDVWFYSGLITTERKGVDPAAAPFAKAPWEIEGLGLREGANLVKVLQGTKHNNGKVLKAMRESDSPKLAIFAMSNLTVNGDWNGKLFSQVLVRFLMECCKQLLNVIDEEIQSGIFVSSYEKYITVEVRAAIVRAAVAKELAEGRCDVGPRELRQMSKEVTVEYVKPNTWFPVYSPLLFMRNEVPTISLSLCPFKYS
ncbi:unnamed protein product [Camellia sinensis]